MKAIGASTLETVFKRDRIMVWSGVVGAALVKVLTGEETELGATH